MRIRATWLAAALLVIAAIVAWFLLRPGTPATDPHLTDDAKAAQQIAAARGELEPYEYLTLDQPQPTNVGPGKIEVIEFFWYGCPHCYHFEPYIEAWAKTLPQDVVFVRVPAVINPGWEPFGRVYYTAQLLGVIDKSHRALFDAIHKERRQLHTMDDVARFFAQFGVSMEVFKRTYGSYAVNNRITEAQQLAQAYHIDGVPTMIINGKYKTSVSIVGDPAQTIRVINQLIARER